MAECQLPKLNTRVRFPSPAPTCVAKKDAKQPFLALLEGVPEGEGVRTPERFSGASKQRKPAALGLSDMIRWAEGGFFHLSANQKFKNLGGNSTWHTGKYIFAYTPRVTSPVGQAAPSGP
jgi:hypothetical protein